MEGLGRAITRADLHRRHGRVMDLIGLIVEATGLEAEVGEVCDVRTGRDPQTGEYITIPAEVVGFRSGRTLLMPLGEMTGIAPGDVVTATGRQVSVPIGDHLLGRVLDGLGNPMDDLGSLDGSPMRPITGAPPSPLSRPRITDRVTLGVRALDSLVPCGRGQRLGIFAGSGVGKSSLLGMIARSTSADINVICLVGERGREVVEFIERDLGPAIERSVVVVATSDQPALVRIKAALTATAIAEHFRDQGHDVMLMMDSVTRFAMAQREVGLAIGEPPATRGYTPSVFALLPKLLERSGTSPKGSITALYTVLVDGDDMNEPIADAVRSILDGHIVLTRQLAHAGHYPAIDVLQSVSRLEGEIMTPDVREGATRLRSLLAAYRDKKDLIAIGAYERGSDPVTDMAIDLKGSIDGFLKQRPDEAVPGPDSDDMLLRTVGITSVSVGDLAESMAADQAAAAAMGQQPAAATGPSAIPPLNLAV
ncbi:FliI/YscN family ATPase [Baekduia sp. Peel2402]|uniref:FliI/YscN family ATPase n=1 Tax=Baekduia sp. Peel2402 TaxID=3458296 RepID=UPI00403E6D99